MSTVFLTGFPGFLGAALLPRLLNRYPREVTIVCLIQAKYRWLAESRLRQLEQPDRVRLWEGDITRPDLGLVHPLPHDITEIYHLAAVYDLAVSREAGMQVNVAGTRHMLRLAQDAPRLERFHYVSTCYVSGRYNGLFSEEDLEKGQTFNNYYEETKYLAELAVQQEMRQGMPVTIYRPSIVLGDSETGETQKYDGPYYVLQWLLRQPRIALMPVTGNTRQYELNVVPRNFVIDGLAYLSGLKRSLGQVYHLSNPHPLTVGEMLDILAEATGRQLVCIPMPQKVVKGVLEYVPGIHELTRIEPETVNYFAQPTRYSCTQTLRELEGTGIYCPPFAAYARRLVDFMEAHPEISPAAMV